jgi:hypothetical protein
VVGSLLLLVVVVVAGSLLESSLSSSSPLQLGPSSRSRCQRCGARRAERGAARVSAKGCRVGRDMGGGEGAKARGEVAAAVQGESGRRLREGGVLSY